MMEPYTVSGNTVSGNSPQVPSAGAEMVTNNTYTIDNTAVCDLLNALLQEEVKQNEIFSQINETVTAYMESITESGILDSLQDQILVTDIEDSTEGTETEDTETIYRDSLLSSLSGFQETLDGISVTVSGNSVLLENIDGTVDGLYETYAGQTEQTVETDSLKISSSLTVVFATAFTGGIILARIVWNKMR